MTNIQKALQISEKHKVQYRVYLNGQFVIVPSDSECFGSAMEMAEWKDNQFKEYLEKKRNELQEISSKDFYDTSYAFGGVKYLDEIINELFGGE